MEVCLTAENAPPIVSNNCLPGLHDIEVLWYKLLAQYVNFNSHNFQLKIYFNSVKIFTPSTAKFKLGIS